MKSQYEVVDISTIIIEACRLYTRDRVERESFSRCRSTRGWQIEHDSLGAAMRFVLLDRERRPLPPQTMPICSALERGWNRIHPFRRRAYIARKTSAAPPADSQPFYRATAATGIVWGFASEPFYAVKPCRYSIVVIGTRIVLFSDRRTFVVYNFYAFNAVTIDLSEICAFEKSIRNNIPFTKSSCAHAVDTVDGIPMICFDHQE